MAEHAKSCSYFEALSEAYRRILNGTRAWTLDENDKGDYRPGPAVWFKVLMRFGVEA